MYHGSAIDMGSFQIVLSIDQKRLQKKVNPRTPGGFGRTPTPGGGLFPPPPHDLENYAGQRKTENGVW